MSWDVLVAGRYRLRDPLGTGGMGRVWLARDEVLRRDVAIKEVVLPEGLGPEEREELRLRTLREARAAARLNHPNVVKIFDVVQIADRPWIVMEYVPSRSLYEVIRKDGPLPPDRAATIGLALLAALQAAHAAGVLHRDVKPGNVLLADDGRVVLTDFGLAAFDTDDGAVTRPGLVLGSPHYVAPERARDGISSTEADLWSLGATLYAAVEGHSPYARETAMATLTALVMEPPRPPVRAGALKPVLDGLLRKNVRARLGPAEVEPLLQRAAAGGPARRRPARRPRRASPGPTAAPPVRRRGQRRLTSAFAAVASVALLVPVGLAVRAHNLRQPSIVYMSVGPTIGVPACGATTPVPPAVARSHQYAPPSGWRWHEDPSGFSIVVQDDWSHSRSGSVVCFRSPAGERVLAIDSWTQHDLRGYWAAREEELTRAGRLPGYARLRTDTKNFWQDCTTWEFSYQGADGRRLHQTAWAFRTAPGRAYAIYWATPESDWGANLDNLSLVTVSFAPA